MVTRTDLRIQFSKESGYQYNTIQQEMDTSLPGFKNEYIEFLESMVIEMEKVLHG